MGTSTEIQKNDHVTENSTNEASSTERKYPVVNVKPATDIVEYNDHFAMSVGVPGVTHDDLDVTIEKNVLTIEATARFQIPEGYQPLAGQPVDRRYSRTFQLSDEIDRSGIEAELKDGMIHVKLPKCGPAQRTKLEVR
ncbi:Small heat shock protein IbpA [Thalassoglobus neptunius]|uniref:Small heat shock protein IbpA n=1 Tax=Thalassoglobus neptunius TaxID=1938619 RepID=A0A5C5X4V8_9PLAN|nr:Hsp20/alpha crystallin family protein [Thalassoglobus neptunius]TWT57619.1 Small heat shock protein IbpA [Thalassoglobus neptunius]